VTEYTPGEPAAWTWPDAYDEPEPGATVRFPDADAQHDYDALVATWAADGSATSLLVLADWLHDHDRPHAAFACRWAVRFGKGPVFRPDVKRRPWSWHADGCKSEISRRIRRNAPHCVLPRWLMGFGRSDVPDWFEFADPWTAVLYLADRLQAVREQLGLDPDAMPAPKPTHGG
jgi:hypothetical protein